MRFCYDSEAFAVYLEKCFKVQSIRVRVVALVVVRKSEGLVHRRGQEGVAHHEKAQHLHKGVADDHADPGRMSDGRDEVMSDFWIELQ